ncbi:MAG: YggT family protein [Chloroflexi bacterium]|nr:YggT family protein [Chloroflexota bacterium]
MIDVLIRNFLQMLVTAVWLLVLGRVLLSWFDPSRQNRVSQLLIQATEPILSPVRRLLPRSGMFDLSAFVVLIVLGTLMRAIARA